MKKATNKKSVAIFWLIRNKLLIWTTPLDQAEKADVFADSPFSHVEKWREAVSLYPDLPPDYASFPRGRVTYNLKTGTFLLMADKQILSKPLILRKIRHSCGITEKDKIFEISDPHYRT